MHRHFSENLLKILNIFKLIVMVEEIFLISHVTNDISILIHNGFVVQLHKYKHE